MTSVYEMSLNQPQPSQAYTDYERATARYRSAELDVAAASDARAIAVLDMCESGLTTRKVGELLGISGARVGEMCKRGRKVREHSHHGSHPSTTGTVEP